MATTKRLLVLVTFFLSGIAAIFSLVSVGTEEWINARAVWTNLSVAEDNYINYGLFQGTYSQFTASRINYQISMTCAFDLNICGLLCGKDSNERVTLLRQLYNNEINDNYNMDNCAAVARAYNMYYDIPKMSIRSDSTGTMHFINAGVWLSTVIFLLLSAAVGFFASGLALWNTVYNPIEVYFSITGLFVYNAIAFFCTVLYITLWGVLYSLTIIYDVGIYYTLTGKMTSDKRTFLAYSYWISFIPLCLYASSIAVLYTRQYLISKDPGQKNIHIEDAADPAIYLY